MREELMEILERIRPDLEFENEDKLIDDGILDSFDLVSLIGEINETFDIEVSFDDIEPENFNSVEAMLELLQRLEDEN